MCVGEEWGGEGWSDVEEVGGVCIGCGSVCVVGCVNGVCIVGGWWWWFVFGEGEGG